MTSINKLYRGFHKAFNNKIWVEITDDIQFSTLEFNNRLDQPLAFSFVIEDPVIEITDGDFICITHGNLYRVAEDQLFGTVDDPDIEILTGENERYTISCREWDFSGYNLNNYEYSKTSLITILNDIILSKSFVTPPNNFLGGTTSNGIIDKYLLIPNDSIIQSFVFLDATGREALRQLCEENGLYWNLNLSVEPHTINIIKPKVQLVIFDKSGRQAKDIQWAGVGITNQTIIDGCIPSPYLNFDNSRLPDLAAEKKPRLRTDKDVIRNHIMLTVNDILDGAPNKDDIALERYDTIASVPKQTVYKLPYPAFDIKYVGLLVQGLISNDFAATTTEFSISPEIRQSVYFDDIILIKSLGVLYYRKVYSNNLSTIIITEPLPAPPGVNDNFEVIGNIQVFKDNQVVYSDRGCVKETESNQVGQIRFLDLSEPVPGTIITIHYFKSQRSKRQHRHFNSIQKYGLKRFTKRLDGFYTREQLKILFQRLERPDPNPMIEIISYRPTKIGEKIPVNIQRPNFDVNRILNVTEIQGFYKPGLYDGDLPVTEYKLTISEIVDSIDQIIKRLEDEQLIYIPAGPENVHQVTKLDINMSIIDFIPTKTKRVQKIVFSSNLGGVKFNIFIMNTDGSGIQQLTDNTNSPGLEFFSPAFTSDGLSIICYAESGPSDIYRLDITDTNLTPAGTTVTKIISTTATTGQGNNQTGTAHNSDLFIYTKQDLSTDNQTLWTAEKSGANNMLFSLGSGARNVGAEYNRSDTSLVWAIRSVENLFVFRLGVVRQKPDTSIIGIASNTAFNAWMPAFSKDGNTVVYASDEFAPDGDGILLGWGSGNIYTVDKDGGARTRLIVSATVDFNPKYSLDGLKIVYNSAATNTSNAIWDIKTANSNGTGVQTILSNGVQNREPFWGKIAIT